MTNIDTKREIKFRARYASNGKWFYWNLFDETLGEKFIKEETVGEWTGLLDKNGKEIYEGDILGMKISKKIENKLGKYPFNHEVVWRNDGWWCDSNETGERLGDMEHHGDNLLLLEVIGNVLENPELLE